MKGTLIFVQSNTAQTFPEDLVGRYFFVKKDPTAQRHQCTKVSVSQSGTVRVSYGANWYYKLSEIDFELSYHEA